MGCLSLLQGIILTQWLNLGLLYCRWILYTLTHQGKMTKWTKIHRLLCLGLPGCACQCRRCKRHRFNPWVWKIPWREAWQSTAVFLPGKSHGQRSLWGRLQSIGLQRVGHTWNDWRDFPPHTHIKFSFHCCFNCFRSPCQSPVKSYVTLCQIHYFSSYCLKKSSTMLWNTVGKYAKRKKK